jgi:hypothetical protein
MEDCGPPPEGIILPPSSITRMVAREEAWRAINEHTQHCPFVADKINDRLRTVEISMGRLIGFMLGSGALGGAAGGIAAAAVKLLTH